MDTADVDFLSSSIISLVPYLSPAAVAGSQFVFTGGSPVGSGGPHPPGLDTALTAQRMSRKAAANANSSGSDIAAESQPEQAADEAKPQQQSRRGRRGRAGQGRQTQRSSRRSKHGKQQQQPNGAAHQLHTAAVTDPAHANALHPMQSQPVPQSQQPQPQQQTTPNSRGRRRRLLQQTANGTAAAADGAAQPPPPAMSHRRSTLRSSQQRSQAPHTPYNTTAYILAHPPPGARPASSPDRYGADIVDMPEIDQWKGYGSMEKGVKRLRQQGEEERSQHNDEPARDDSNPNAGKSEDRATRVGRSRRRTTRDEPSEDRHSDKTKQEEEEMEHEGAGDTLQPAQQRQRRGRNSGGGRGRGRGRGRGGRGRSIDTSGLREENLRAGDVSPALSGVSGSGSPAHSVVNGDDIERWTRRQRMQRLKLQKSGEAVTSGATQAELGTAAMNGGDDAVMDDQVQHGWMQRVT